MKKYFILIVILILLIINNNKIEQTQMVFDYNEEDMITVNILIPNLNTKNFSSYFDDHIEIVGVYPKINMIYKNKVGNIFYSFNKSSIKENINSFTKYYKNILKKNNFVSDLVLSDYNGIDIEKVRAYISYESLKKILSGCDNCSYQKLS